MIIRAINRLNFSKQIGHHIGGYKIIDRYRQGIVCVNGALLQTHGMELWRWQCQEQYSGRTMAERSSCSVSRIALATGVVLVLGTAG